MNIFGFLVVIGLLVMRSDQCDKYCRDCVEDKCLSCFKSFNSGGKCTKTGYNKRNKAWVEGCIVYDSQNHCLECEEDLYFYKFEIVKDQGLKITCGKKGNLKTEHNIEKCKLMFDLKDEKDRLNPDYRCYMCESNLKPSEDNKHCVHSGEKTALTMYYILGQEAIQTCQDSTKVANICTKNIPASLNNCANALTGEKCILCNDDSYLKKDGSDYKCTSNLNA
jgi:hypothetical protein